MTVNLSEYIEQHTNSYSEKKEKQQNNSGVLFVLKQRYLTNMASNKNRLTKPASLTNVTDQPMNSNLESFACLWLDQNVNSTQDNRDTQKELRQVINHLRTFGNSDECEQYIGQITQEKVVLIVSGSLGRQIVPRLHDFPQFSACYVFCQDKKANEQWANKFHKVRHIQEFCYTSKFSFSR